MTASSVLPPRRVRLFGRADDAATLRELLATSPGRLVTILGPGGCGKTSLALELAHQTVPAFADEGYWVELETCQDAGSVPATVRAAVGVSGSAGPGEALVAALKDRQALLVMDNCEHLLPGVAPLVDRLLSSCPDLRVLATSRAPLRVRGEQIYALEPLAVPGSSAGEDIERLPSVALFLERARAATGKTQRGAAFLRDVARICRRVDGLPLAIELAAAQSLVLSAQQIADRLDASLGLPVDVGGTQPERHRTMQGTLEWSYSLLSEADRPLFELCGVFNGPWTLDALEAISEEGQEATARLARLVEFSLVSPVEGRERRYRLLAPVREYTLDLTRQHGTLEAARERHARYYCDRAMELAGRQGSRQLLPDELSRIRPDYENYMAALDWAMERRDTRLAMRLVQALWIYWRVSERAAIGFDRLEALLRAGLSRPEHEAICHAGLSNFLQLMGQRDSAVDHAETALRLFRQAGSAIGPTLCLGTLGELAAEHGDFERARECYAEALSLQPEDRLWTRGILLADWGIAEYRAGALGRAHDLLSEAERVLEQLPEMWYGGLVRIRQGSIAHARGDFPAASRLIHDGISAVDRMGAGQEVAHGLEAMAAVESSRRRFARVASLLGAAEKLRENANTPVPPSDMPAAERTLREARRTLGENEFSAAWVYGRGLGRAEAVAFAISDTSPVLEPAPLAELTAREREVAGLVAQGLSNAQIADQLVISAATARTHVERIRTKLGVRSRVAVARLLSEQPAAL